VARQVRSEGLKGNTYLVKLIKSLPDYMYM